MEVSEIAKTQKRISAAFRRLLKNESIMRVNLNECERVDEYTLGNKAIANLPTLLEQEFGLKIKGKLLRDYVKNKQGDQIEVNILGKATNNGDKFIIIGECKVQLSKNKICEFSAGKLKRLAGVFEGQLFPILIAHWKTEPDVDDFARKQGIKRVYYSYEFGH